MKKLVVMFVVIACGGGSSNQATAPSTQESTTTPSATPTASAAPSASVMASASASATAPSDPDMPMEFISVMTDSTTLMLKGVNLMVSAVNGTSTCDKAAADLSKLANDPTNLQIEKRFAAEYGKLSPEIQRTMAPELIAARAKLKSALAPHTTAALDGGASLCGNNQKLRAATDAFNTLMAIGLKTVH